MQPPENQPPPDNQPPAAPPPYSPPAYAPPPVMEQPPAPQPYAPAPYGQMPPVVPAKRSRGPVLAIVLIAVLVLLAGGGYLVGGFVYAQGKINSATDAYNSVVDHQNKLTDFFTSFNKQLATNNDPSKETADALKQEKALYAQLVSQSQAAAPQIDTDDAALASANSSLSENSWLTALSSSSLNKESQQLTDARAALAIAKTIVTDSVQFGNFMQAFDDANIDNANLNKDVDNNDGSAIVSDLSSLKSHLSTAITLDKAPGLPPEMDTYLKLVQSVATDVTDAINFANQGDQTGFDNALKKFDSDSKALDAFDFSAVSSKITSFYQGLTDQYNAQVDKANKASS